MFKDKNKYVLDYIPDTDIPRRLWDYVLMVIKRNPIMWTIMVVCDICHALRYPLAFMIVGKTIDVLAQSPLENGIPEAAWHNIAAIFVILLIGEACHGVTAYVLMDWWRGIRAKLRSDLMSYSLSHSHTYFQEHFAGSLSRKITEGIERGLNINQQIRLEMLLPLTSMSFSGVVLFSMAPLYGGLVALFIMLIMLPVFLRLKKLRTKSQIYSDICSKVSGQVVDTLSNIASVKSYAHEEQEMREHRRVSEEQMVAWHKMLRAFLMLDNYRRVTLVLFGAGMVFACALGWQHGYITVGDMATITGLAFSFTTGAWILSFGVIHLMESAGYLNDSLSTLIKPHSVSDKEDCAKLVVTKGVIEFDEMSFDYGEASEGRPVFEKLSVRIEAGQKIGLIGPSGAGKSSFVNLIQRFFDVNSGAILIDGQDIRDVSQKSLRSQIAVIPQDTSLFHRSIMENIRYGRLDASDEEVIAAAEKAYARGFIDELPDGFDTLVGERGVKLSGGQRQRIAIARAILKDAPILILDEATSALDSESEHLIQDSLLELMKGKTVIAIAHRLSTIQHMDRLIVMQGGAIAEDGTHTELLEQGGLYARLWGMQSGGFLPKD